ncbi:hypothetical protein AX23_02940 [Brucella melitensis 548]|nr:hypothetical protein AX23_02940 [Brucella melitensis 548]
MSLPDTIAPTLSGALTARGYNTLTAVQNAVLAPETLASDLLVSAQTGSGKTVAFGLAMANTILEDELRFGDAGAPLAMIIAPTRELALQVRRELEWLYADTGARIASCVGGMDIRTERRALERGSHIVVGTPGRLRDHITRNALDMSQLRAIVLDEADEMLDMGFREDLEFILGEAPEDRRTLMFSATVPKPIAQLAKRFQNNALRITVQSETSQHADIDYVAMPVPPHERDHAIINTLLYYDSQNSIIFCSTREAVKHMASRLSNRGFAVVALSGELSQAERNNALQAMRDGAPASVWRPTLPRAASTCPILIWSSMLICQPIRIRFCIVLAVRAARAARAPASWLCRSRAGAVPNACCTWQSLMRRRFPRPALLPFRPRPMSAF